ncbi:hemagglutinin repeat-containing protein [Variovorax sp. IB41]|uniref:hemagglutinin repeat-containing protein n=1 Tax=Variovorax sp. IB41 TaxID=2779370 RepID=UPI0018E790EE|nr:hemagglutinin repeat-containing protein [Variovorax sp. IB41]MBJ2157405.1 hemagglutinin repeat-containing protein [Variovorax sp. IB41]
MNRHLHRIVFNAARGMRMVVQETATSTGKGASKATSTTGTGAFVGAALAGMLAMAPVNAQIVGAPNVPGNLRPTVLVAPNGVPLINVQTPSAAGVSRNVYNQFNVGPDGAIFNNSRTNAQTQLGGIVQGNPYLAGGPARIILNEVNGGNVSQLRGYMEVAGQRAEIIIANPAGINVDGAGFINASRATLTTGTPQLNALGGLDSFLVRGGTVTINGAGLDASKTDYAAILARAVEANAGIWASELKVVTGANQVSADHSQISPTTGTGAAPTFALDVAALGGMYAGKIVLIGTEAGLGVRNAGTIQAAPGTPALAGAGQLVVTSAGRLENIGTIQATADANIAASNLANSGRISSGGNLKVATQDALANSFNGAGGTLEGARVELASAAGNIDNRSGGTIRQTSSVALGISAPALSNTNGGVIGLEPVPETTSQPGGGTNPGSGGGTDTGGGTATPGTPAAGGGSGSGATITPAPYVPPSPGTITAAGAILNDGGRIYAGGPITLQSANINNNGGTLSLASMTVNQPAFDNHGGTLNISNGFSANVDRFDNTGGKLNAGSLNIASSGDLINVDGTLTSAADANLMVGGKADNTHGTMSAAGALTANAAGATNNTGGTLASNQGLTLNSGSLDNTKGSIQSAQAGVQLGVTNALVNGSGGSINAAADLGIQAGSLANGGSLRGANDVNVAVGGAMTNGGSVTAGRNTTITAGSLQGSNTGVLGAGIQSDGKLGGVGELRVTTSGALVANGTNLAAGNATLQGASVDVSSSQTSATNIAVTATQGGVITSKATVVTPGTLSITASSNAAQTLANDAGTLNASQLQINVSNLANTNGGEIVQTGTGATTIATSGTLNNDGGRIASNGQDLTLQGATIGNVNGKIEHAGTGTLTIGGGTFNGANGQITTNNALVVAMSSAFNQDGGATSAKQVTIGAASLSNRGGRIVQTGAAAGSIAVAGTVDNTSGIIANGGDATVATGDLSINAANIINSKGLIHSLGTTSLNAATILNDQTQGAGQGIEGKNVTIAVSNLNNDAGAIRADVNATITSGGTVTNTNGLISAGDTLAIVDPNAANPAAKTLNLVNTGGTLVADNSLKIDAATFSGDGKALSGKDLSIALTQDIVNNGQVAANGNLTYTTTGNFTNNGKLLAGQTLTVGGNNVDNTASAEMAGTDTIVNASGTLTNRGLIDSQGNTQINAGTLNNIGTGRIYGDDVSIATGTLNNDAETVAGVTKAGTIAARGDLDIGATTINNREHALIFSQGSMYIGGALDASRVATGQGAVLNNLSADIESIGDLDIAMANVNNRDVHIQLGAPQVTNSALTGIAPMTPVGSGVGRTTPYPLDEVNVDPINGFVYRKDTGELVGIGGYGIWYNAITTTEDTAINADPAHLVAGGHMNVNGQLYNENSQVLAGGTITATSYQSSQLSGTRTITGSATVIDNEGNILAQNVPIIVPPQTIALGGYKYQPNINATTGHNGGSAPASGGVGNAGGSSGANGGIPPGVVVEVSAITGSAGSSAGVPMVVRTSMPNIGIPNASLFVIHAGPGRYLIETDPRFANYRNWLSSDYLLNNLGLDPNNTLKRLGDGFYEQKLIREQVAQLTGYRYLDGYSNDDDQYTALMDAGATFAKQYGLRPGIGLSAAQMAQLTSDIVWLVEQTVTLPDGTTQRVLVPQVYVRVRPGDIDGSGALLSADATVIKSSGDVTNTGTIAGRTLVSIKAENINNLGGRISGGQVALDARTDLNLIGGTVDARDAALLTAGRDLNIRTTTQSTGGMLNNTAIDRVAGVYVSNPGGVLLASAGRDVNLVGAILANGGKDSRTLVKAGRDVNLGTVTESSTIFASGGNARNSFAGVSSQTREIGSSIVGGGSVALVAGNDVNARAAEVAAAGTLAVAAGHDIRIDAGQASQAILTTTNSSRKTLTSKSSSSEIKAQADTTVLGSSFSGKDVVMSAGNDLVVRGSQVSAQNQLSLGAGRDVRIESAQEQSANGSVLKSSQSGLNGLKDSVLYGRGYSSSSSNQTQLSASTTQVGSTISGGSVSIDAGRDAQIIASNVLADKNIAITAGRNIDVLAAQDTSVSATASGGKSRSFSPSPGLAPRHTLYSNMKGSEDGSGESSTAVTSLISANGGNLTMVAGLDSKYAGTGQGNITTEGADLLAKNKVSLSGNAVNLNASTDSGSSKHHAESKNHTIGAQLSGLVGGAITSAYDAAQESRKTDDSRLKGALELKAGYDAYKLATDGALGNGIQSLTDAGTGGDPSGALVGVSVSESRTRSRSDTAEVYSNQRGTNIQAGSIEITARETDINMQGAKLQAQDIALDAKRDINLLAAENKAATLSRNSGSSLGGGVTFGFGSQNGFSIQVNAGSNSGKATGLETHYDNTLITATNSVKVKSGGDLNMKGAQIAADAVKADIGGNLNIESLQDSTTYNSKQSSSGLDVSLCIPPICYGQFVSATVNASKQKVDHNYQSATGQSGIAAGNGGYDVSVKGNTDLKGGAITSTAPESKNSLTTGSLTTSDLQNRQNTSSSSSAVSLSFSYGAGAASNVLSNVARSATNTALANLNGGKGLPANNSQSSQTLSVISPGSIKIVGTGNTEIDDKSNANVATLTARDPATANGALVNTLTLQQAKEIPRLQQEAQDRQRAAQLVGSVINNVIGDVAAKQGWAEGGTEKIVLHTIAGIIQAKIGDGSALTGAVAGALNEVLLPEIERALNGQGIYRYNADGTPNREFAELLTTSSTMLGAAVGASTGNAGLGATVANNATVNNRLLHENEKAKIKQLANGDADLERKLTEAACFMTRCADGKRDGDPAKADLQATDQAIAANANGEYTRALELLRNAQSATLFNYTEADQRLDRLNAIDPRNVGGLSVDEKKAKNQNLDACRGVTSCTDDVNTRYDRIVSDRAESTITAINAMKSLDLCAPGDTTCAAGSLVQLQAVRADMKAEGATTDQTDVIGLNAYIARASAAAGDASSLLNAVGAAAIGATASNAGNAGAGKLIGEIGGLTKAEKAFVNEMLGGGRTVEVIPTSAARTPDFKIDGVQYELKTMTNVLNESADGISKALSSTIMHARGQSGQIIVDARGQKGMTPEIAERGVARAFGRDNQSGSKIESITVITSAGTVHIPRSR